MRGRLFHSSQAASRILDVAWPFYGPPFRSGFYVGQVGGYFEVNLGGWLTLCIPNKDLVLTLVVGNQKKENTRVSSLKPGNIGHTSRNVQVTFPG